MRALLLAALIASPAMAEVAPRPVGPDPRIRTLAYDPDEVFRLNLAMKFITHIRFAPGEAVQSVSVVTAIRALLSGWSDCTPPVL